MLADDALTLSYLLSHYHKDNEFASILVRYRIKHIVVMQVNEPKKDIHT